MVFFVFLLTIIFKWYSLHTSSPGYVFNTGIKFYLVGLRSKKG